MIKSFIFSIVETKLNIAFTTSVASHFTKNLGHQYTKDVKKTLQYLKRLQDSGIIYTSQKWLLVKR